MRTVIIKEKAIKFLTNDKILILKESYFNDRRKDFDLEPDKNFLYEIRFSKSSMPSDPEESNPQLGTRGFLVMYLSKDGTSTISISGTTSSILSINLTFEETKNLLKSSSNYKSNIDKLGTLFGE